MNVLDISEVPDSVAGFHPDSYSQRLQRIVEHVRDQLGGRYVVLESEYIDRDFKSEHGLVYTHQFRTVPNVCARLHFFRKEPKESRLFQEAEYVGYCVLRPLAGGPPGRTVLSPPARDVAGTRLLTLTAASFKPHLQGERLSVSGVAFCSQDGMAMRCAQADLWMATRVMYKRQGLPLYFPEHINSAAGRGYSPHGRTFPMDGGLYLDQMVNALNQLGYEPALTLHESYKRLTVEQTVKGLTPHLLSGSPAILGVPRHVVCAIGLMVSRTAVRTVGHDQAGGGLPYLRRFEDWIAGFVVHDDAVGPYRLIPAADWLGKSKSLRTQLAGRLRETTDPADADDTSSIDSILVPSTPDLWMRAEDAHYHGVKTCLLNNRFWSLLAIPGATNLEELCKLAKSQAVIRWRAVSSKQLKTDVLAESKVARYMASVHMPRTIWLAELLWEEELKKTPDQWRVFGEIVVDATANAFHPSVLAVHLPGVLVTQDLNVGWSGYWQTPCATVTGVPKDAERPDRLWLPPTRGFASKQGG